MLTAIALSATPDAGTIIKQLPTIPTLKENISLPKLEKTYAPAMKASKDNVSVYIKTIAIQGNSIIDSQDLYELVKSYENRSLTFVDIQEVANIITKHYREKKYFVAKAYIPSQELNKQILTIQIIEGQYGKFNIINNSLVDTNILSKYLPQESDIIHLVSLEKNMMLINDLSGSKITEANIRPGINIGTSDFDLNIEKTQRIQIYSTVDNYGSKSTGENRVNIGMLLNSLSGSGDSLSLSALNSFSGGVKNIGTVYRLPIEFNGLKFDFGANNTKYKLQGSYSSLNAYGEANIFNFGFCYPLILSQRNSLYIEGKAISNRTNDVVSLSESKKHVNSLQLSLLSKNTNSIFDKLTSFDANIGFTRGQVILDNNDAIINDLNIETQGYFSKLSARLTETLFLTNELLVKIQIQGQTSFNKNLNSSEKLSIGGENGVRAYTYSDLSADEAIIGSLEVNYIFPNINNFKHGAGVFIDTSKAFQNANPYENVVENIKYLKAFGIAYDAVYNNIRLKTSLAHAIEENSLSSAQENKNKFFAQLSLIF